VREARVLHLNLRESYGGRRFPLETDAAASYAAEAAVFELRMAGMTASGQVCHAVIGKAAEAITAEAAEWGADLIILGPSRRGELATRLLGSVTQHVLQHAPCPVLVASPASKADLTALPRQSMPPPCAPQKRLTGRQQHSLPLAKVMNSSSGEIPEPTDLIEQAFDGSPAR
jgi:hypothetical protein